MSTTRWARWGGKVLALGALAWPALAQQPTAPARAPAPATLALLVGINNYAAPAAGDGFHALAGAENDVARARQLLIEHFRFAPESIETLIGPAATHAAIVTKFHEHLVQKAGPDTRVVFWFSGHGARIPDASGRDGAAREEGEPVWDDTLVAYDSRSTAGDGSFDLADDELFTLLRALPSKDVLVVTDCCHSGGVLRGSSNGVVRDAGRGTAPLDRTRVDAIWPKGLCAPAEDGEGNIDDLSNVVLVAACSATEEAGELSLPLNCEANCTHYGTCTYYLSQALRSAGPQATWNEVVEQTHASAIGRGSRSQRIHVIGDGQRLVMGGRGRPVPPGYLCEQLGESQLSIAAGSIHGLGNGARVDLVDHDGKKLGAAVVDRVGDVSCTATWQGRDPAPREAMRARPTSFGQLEPTFRIAVAEGIPRSLFADIPYVGIVDAPHADVTIEHVGEQLALRQADGRRSKAFAAEPEEVRAAMLREHHRRVLWNSVATPGAFDVGVEVLPATEADAAKFGTPRAGRLQVERGAGRAIGGVVGVTADDPALSKEANKRNGGLVRVRAWNCSDRDLHVAIVSVAENGEIWVLHGKDESNVVRAGQEFTKCVWLIRSTDWPADQALVDRYLVIATPSYADFKPFAEEHPTLTRGAGDLSALPSLLRQALGGARTRGAFEPANTVPEWGIAFADLRLVTPEMFDRMPGR